MGPFLRIDPDVYILGALYLYLLPFPWVAAAVTAGTAHEVSHLIALKMAGVKVQSITLGSFGAKIETAPMEPIQEVISALAGPAGSFLMLFLCRVFPEAALCGIIQGMFNLIPVYPMDGGRALRCAVGEKRCRQIEKMVILLLFIAGLYGVLNWNLGIGACFPAMILSVNARHRKIPCIGTKKAVQ